METSSDPLNLQRPDESLLKYDFPIVQTLEDTLTKDPLQSHKKPQLPPLESRAGFDDILCSLFPNLELDEENKHFIYKISQEQASRHDLDDLEKKLQMKLLERQARFFLLYYKGNVMNFVKKNGNLSSSRGFT